MTDGMGDVPPTAGLALSWRDLVPSTGSLERDLADFLGQPDTQIECSGTAALIVALTTLSLTSRRRSVVIPAYSCPLVPLAVAHCRLTPVLCDTRLGHFDFCPDSLAALCNHETLAVIPTHLGGRVADLATATAIARRVGAFVVEDAAQSLGAQWEGQFVGSVGDCGFFSLGVGKGLTIYAGGAVVARDTDLRRQLRATSAEIVSSRPLWEFRRCVELIGYLALYWPSGLRLAFGLPLRQKLRRGKLIEAVGDDCSANIPLHRVSAWRKTVGARALRRFPAFLEAASAQALPRKARLAAIPGLQVIEDAAGSIGTWPFLQVLMPTSEARDHALAQLWYERLGVGRLFIHALNDYPAFVGLFGKAPTPNARDFAARMLTISNSPWLHDHSFAHICSVLERTIQRRNTKDGSARFSYGAARP